jgi:hypothetical protein
VVKYSSNLTGVSDNANRYSRSHHVSNSFQQEAIQNDIKKMSQSLDAISFQLAIVSTQSSSSFGPEAHQAALRDEVNRIVPSTHPIYASICKHAMGEIIDRLIPISDDTLHNQRTPDQTPNSHPRNEDYLKDPLGKLIIGNDAECAQHVLENACDRACKPEGIRPHHRAWVSAPYDHTR